jgi:hypothetical protein
MRMNRTRVAFSCDTIMTNVNIAGLASMTISNKYFFMAYNANKRHLNLQARLIEVSKNPCYAITVKFTVVEIMQDLRLKNQKSDIGIIL